MCKEKEIVKIPQAVINTMSDLEKIIYGISPCSSIKEACKEINTNKNAELVCIFISGGLETFFRFFQGVFEIMDFT